MTSLEIIDKYCAGNEPLRALLLHHSRQVLYKAMQACDRHPELHIDRTLVEEGSLLHDIGIVMCDAPGIHCYGSYHYLYHGVAGARIMRELGREDIARICERHTGTGLPGLEPETLEEQIVCYADKFYSKSKPDHVRTVAEAAQSLEKFGHEGVLKFLSWAERFE